jgi:hypothetical protein
MMIWSFGVLGIYFFTSLFLQGNLGFSPTTAVLAFVPMALCLAVAATLSPRVTAIIGGHRTVAIGMAVMTVGLLLCLSGWARARRSPACCRGSCSSISGPG